MKALVTGGANGLGRALVEQLLNAGHDVVAVDREENGLDALAVESKGALTVHLCDLSGAKAIQAMIDSLGEPQFDLVILNAGISATGRFEEIPSTAYENLINVNVQAPILIIAALVKGHRISKGGKLVCVSSLSHAVGYPGASVYAATKDALAIYANSIRRPFAKQGIHVLTVFPGPVRTAQAERHAPPGANAQKRMAPQVLAAKILKAAKGRKKVLYPGNVAAMGRFLGAIAPRMATRLMKRTIYDKLRQNIH